MNHNALRYTSDQPRDHVESYFLKANEPNGERALWLRTTIFSRASEPGSTVAEGWAIAFDRRNEEHRHCAIKCTLPISRAHFSRDGFGVRWAEPGEGTELDARDGASKGYLRRGNKNITWDLAYAPSGPALELLPFQWMYSAPFPKSKLVTPAPDAVFSGEVTVNGERWQLDGWRGMQGHNWGRGNADLYAWCHVNAWENGDEPCVLEAVSARVRTGPVLLPMLTGVAVRLRDVDYKFNRPTDMARARASIDGLVYKFEVVSDLGRVQGEIEADPRDMVGLHYANPRGPMTFCENSKLAAARITFEPTGRPPIHLVSKAAALEIGTHDRHPDVVMMA